MNLKTFLFITLVTMSTSIVFTSCGDEEIIEVNDQLNKIPFSLTGSSF